MDNIQALEEKKIEPAIVNAKTNAAGKVINGVRTELEGMKLFGRVLNRKSLAEAFGTNAILKPIGLRKVSKKARKSHK